MAGTWPSGVSVRRVCSHDVHGQLPRQLHGSSLRRIRIRVDGSHRYRRDVHDVRPPAAYQICVRRLRQPVVRHSKSIQRMLRTFAYRKLFPSADVFTAELPPRRGGSRRNLYGAADDLQPDTDRDRELRHVGRQPVDRDRQGLDCDRMSGDTPKQCSSFHPPIQARTAVLGLLTEFLVRDVSTRPPTNSHSELNHR